MLKALFLDMDDTLCDTQSANTIANAHMANSFDKAFGGTYPNADFQRAVAAYHQGIYRLWTDTQQARYLPIIEKYGEQQYRVRLIQDVLAIEGIEEISEAFALKVQKDYDAKRLEAFDFYPGIRAFLASARRNFTLVVITNGPEFSQIPKLQAVNMAEHVDHIIIGGQEPAQKPERSIFDKALALANCQAHEAIHVGDSLSADIAGACNAGITSVWIQHQQPLDAELGINPHHTLLRPEEIPALIETLSEANQ